MFRVPSCLVAIAVFGSGCTQRTHVADAQEPVTQAEPKTRRSPDQEDAVYFLVAREPAKALAIMESLGEQREAQDIALHMVALCALDREPDAIEMAQSMAQSQLVATPPAGEGEPASSPLEMLFLPKDLLERNDATPCGTRVEAAYERTLHGPTRPDPSASGQTTE